MTHPLIPTIDALVVLLTATFPDYDVFDYLPEDYAGSVAIILEDSVGEMSRDRLAAPTRLPFAESWAQDIAIYPSQEVYSLREGRTMIMEIMDDLITAITADVTLGISSKGLVRCSPREGSVRFEEGVLRGLVQLDCEYRISRSTP